MSTLSTVMFYVMSPTCNTFFSSNTSVADPLYNDQSPVSSPSEESDSSEFERIEVDMIPPLSEIVNHAIHNAEDDEENKMDVAGARPISQMVRACMLLLVLFHVINLFLYRVFYTKIYQCALH